MTADSPILVGVFDGFSWIRPEGKGSFQNSPAVKAFADGRLLAGEKLIVVDLSACTGMDSTFMGTLAGMAARLSAHDKGCLHIAEPGDRNRRSLEDLGLDFLMEIDPPDTVWRGSLDAVRSELHPPNSLGALGKSQRAKHVLAAHQALAGLNDENAREFSEVVSHLERELRDKAEEEKPAHGGS